MDSKDAGNKSYATRLHANPFLALLTSEDLSTDLAEHMRRAIS